MYNSKNLHDDIRKHSGLNPETRPKNIKVDIAWDYETGYALSKDPAPVYVDIGGVTHMVCNGAKVESPSINKLLDILKKHREEQVAQMEDTFHWLSVVSANLDNSFVDEFLKRKNTPSRDDDPVHYVDPIDYPIADVKINVDTKVAQATIEKLRKTMDKFPVEFKVHVFKGCGCSKPNRTENSAAGEKFYVCAKSKGGCGKEVL